MLTWIIILIAVIACVVIFATIFKSFAKTIILLGFIYIVFHVAFLWNWSEVSNKINFVSFFKPEYRQKIEDGINKIEERKSDTDILDSKSIESLINESIEKTISSGIDKINKEDVMNDLKEKIQEIDKEKIDEILIDLEKKLSEYNNK